MHGDEGKGVSIESNPDVKKPVVWRTPRTHNDNQPLVHIDSVFGLRIKGFVLDGLDRIPTLVVVSGNCPGTKLEDLRFQGFQQCAVVFDRAAGTSDEPVSLTNSRIAPWRDDALGALRFEEADHVRLSDNRLEGPFQSAIALNGPTTNLELGSQSHLQRDRWDRVPQGHPAEPAQHHPGLEHVL